MREEEWLNWTDPLAMLAYLRAVGTNPDRKLRLFVCACWRPRVRVVVQQASLLRDIEVVESGEYSEATPMRFYPTFRDPWEAAVQSSKVGIRATTKMRPPEPGLNAAQQADLLRCLFGNPFRPFVVDPVWLNNDVIVLAQAAYDERLLPSGHLDGVLLAVLADALEDAGCTDATLLGHLREAGPHVRGCFAVDAVLGRV